MAEPDLSELDPAYARQIVGGTDAEFRAMLMRQLAEVEKLMSPTARARCCCFVDRPTAEQQLLYARYTALVKLEMWELGYVTMQGEVMPPMKTRTHAPRECKERLGMTAHRVQATNKLPGGIRNAILLDEKFGEP
jgi:hypothetical protein